MINEQDILSAINRRDEEGQIYSADRKGGPTSPDKGVFPKNIFTGGGQKKYFGYTPPCTPMM